MEIIVGKYEFIAPCHFGLEAVLKKEIIRLGPAIDVLASCICEKHRCIVGFACLFGVEVLDLCLTVFEQSSGDLRGERLFPLLKEAVIFPHHELTATVSAVKILFVGKQTDHEGART